MKVLFVAGGNSKNFDIAPFIKAQGDSLINEEVEIIYFPIRGKGLVGYLSNVLKLRKFIRNNPIDIIHAHYTLSGLTAILALSGKPIVLSLMGTDAYGEYIGENKIKFGSQYLTILTYLIQPFVNKIICKSENIQNYVYLKNRSTIIPNGILLQKFLNSTESRVNKKHPKSQKKQILFLGDKKDPRKNYKLVENAVRLIGSNDIQILTPYPIPHNEVVKYLNSVDVLVVPSFMEGSPNLVKEAMACNCPVVATDVGDVAWLFGEEPGYFITSFKTEEVAKKIHQALHFSENHIKTRGRERILELGLDSKKIAKRINKLYFNVINKR